MHTEMILPHYLKRAIRSRLARTEPYSSLTLDEWTDLAMHMYRDETHPLSHTGQTFLRRGTQNSYGKGVRRTLDGLLCSAVIDHTGVTEQAPHFAKASDVYAKTQMLEKLTAAGL